MMIMLIYIKVLIKKINRLNVKTFYHFFAIILFINGGYMINIEEFDNAKLSGMAYSGYNGSKKGIIIDNEKWFLTYPKKKD